MNLTRAQQILDRYGIDVDIRAPQLYNSAYHTYDQIQRIGDPLSEEEHLILFDTFWSLGNREKGTNVMMPEHLKLKIIRVRNLIVNDYLGLTIANFNFYNTRNLIQTRIFSESEESDLWNIFHQLRPDISTRNSDQINKELGLYKIIDTKLKWFGKLYALDLGCGKNGTGIATLVSKYKNKIKGFGVDLDIQEHPSYVKLYEANAENLPFRDNSFDVIYSCAVVGYFKDDKIVNIIKEILRVLKPKGIFIFTDGRGFAKYKNEIVPQTAIRARVFKYGGVRRILIIKY